MDLTITKIDIQLGDKSELKHRSYIPSVGELVLVPDHDNPGKWIVSFRPQTREVEMTLDLHSADKAVEHLTNIKKMMVGIQNVLENPGE